MIEILLKGNWCLLQKVTYLFVIGTLELWKAQKYKV